MSEDSVNDTAHQPPSTSSEIRCGILQPYNLFGWTPDVALSDDENYMDVVLLVTRNSVCLQGSMGCILVNPPLAQQDDQATSNDVDQSQEKRVEQLQHRLCGAIIGAATNGPLFSELDSDVHAEIGALGGASRTGKCTDGCTAYITMPPCKRCFGSLWASGVRRIVTLQPCPASVADVASKHAIELANLSGSVAQKQKARINSLTNMGVGSQGSKTAEQLADVAEQRKRRREEKKARKERAKSKIQKKGS